MKNDMKNIFYRLLFPALGLWFFTVSGCMAQSPDKMISLANKAFFNDDWVTALPLYEKAVMQKPDDLKINYRLGLILLHLREPEKAIPYLLKASKLTPKYNLEFTRNLAQAYHQSGNFEEAIVQYQAALTNTKAKDEEEIQILKKRIEECISGQQLRSLPATAEIRNLLKPLNTVASEHVPLLQNNTLIFTSNRKVSTKKQQDEDIYFSRLEGEQWSEPQAFGGNLNTAGHDAATGISADGQTLYIYRHNNGGDIYQVKRSGSSWGTPEPLPEPINSEFYEPSVFITPDNQYAFFSSDRYDGFGGLDLYLSMRQPDGTWSEALNLGANINTEYDEDAPFISADGSTLYFSSRGHNSMGGYDIFSSGSSGPAWSKAVNLGFPVNSPFDDIYLITNAAGNHGFFCSDRTGGAGDKDIYNVTFRSAVATDSLIAVAEPEPVKEEPAKPAVPEVQTVMLRGKVTEAGLGAPLAAQLVLTEINNVQSPVYANADSLSGGYQFEVERGKKYRLVARKEGYFYATENLTLSEAFPRDTLAKNFVLRKIKTGAKLVLNNLFFEYNSDNLTTGSKEELNRLYELLLENPGLSVEISGHTDSKGSAAYNQTLSLKRAQAVVKYLQNKGVGNVKLKAVGFGASRPIASNKTESGRKQNRRTEFKVIHD